MKCDELKAEQWLDYSGEPNRCYPANKVDEAIAELKDKCQMHDFFWEGNGFDKMGFKNTIQVREYIDKLKAENAELKFKLKKINDNFAIKAKLVYERHERHTLRALWLARAERAKAVVDDCDNVVTLCKTFRPLEEISPLVYHKAITWQKIEQLCKKKAEEYK